MSVYLDVRNAEFSYLYDIKEEVKKEDDILVSVSTWSFRPLEKSIRYVEDTKIWKKYLLKTSTLTPSSMDDFKNEYTVKI